jgi:hypothetical protein
MPRVSVLSVLATCALLAACSEKPEAAVEPVAPKAAMVPTDSASLSVSSSADMAAVLGAPQGSSVCRNYKRKLGTLVSAQASGSHGAQTAAQVKAQVEALKAMIADACD